MGGRLYFLLQEKTVQNAAVYVTVYINHLRAHIADISEFLPVTDADNV